MVANSRLLGAIAARLRDDEPIKPTLRETAGVAVIFKPTRTGEEILLIRRAERGGDPWSGQIAFPGGRVEPGDSTFRDTSTRETAEELGMDITSSQFLGYMDTFNPANRNIAIVPSVFLLEVEVPAVPNAEVSSYRWVEFEEFLSEKNRSTHELERGGMKLTFPSFKIGDYVVWGLTERILSTLVGYLQS